MSDRVDGRAKRALAGLRPHVGRAALVLAGFALGGLVFGSRACDGPAPDAGSTGGEDVGDETVWTCSMHPQVRQSAPGSCPICGMDLIPVGDGDGDAPDPSTIVLSDRAQALAKLRTTPVRRRREASTALRLLGRVRPDETTLKTVTAWTGGRIDRLRVSVTGQRVRAGQVIATLYSPEIFAAHQDLLVAKRQLERMADSPPASRQAAAAAFEAARERLRLLGVPDAELAKMEVQPRPTRAVAIRTPFGGTVIERLATEGAYVSTGTPLYRVADLRRLWVQLDAYESDLPRLTVGQDVRLTVEALPGEVFEGKVTFIDPTLDARRRTAQVRVEVKNREGRLRPGMFAEARVMAAARVEGERGPLVVPDTAPLFTGRRAIVYVEVREGGQTGYEARTVRLGPRTGTFYPVVAGLSEGDVVVSRGAFAIDADLQIRGGHSMMMAAGGGDEGAWDAVLELPASERAKLDPVVSAYLAIQKALAEDTLAPAKAAATEMVTAVGRVEIARPSVAMERWASLAAELGQHARHVSKAADLEGARAGFEALSQGIEVLLRRFGNPLDAPLHLAFCPMAAGSEGASWVQKGEKIDNSYFGASMRTCGEVKDEVAPGGYLRAAQPDAPPWPAGGHRH